MLLRLIIYLSLCPPALLNGQDSNLRPSKGLDYKPKTLDQTIDRLATLDFSTKIKRAQTNSIFPPQHKNFQLKTKNTSKENRTGYREKKPFGFEKPPVEREFMLGSFPIMSPEFFLS